jgi:hypothetical protein
MDPDNVLKLVTRTCTGTDTYKDMYTLKVQNLNLPIITYVDVDSCTFGTIIYNYHAHIFTYHSYFLSR